MKIVSVIAIFLVFISTCLCDFRLKYNEVHHPRDCGYYYTSDKISVTGDMGRAVVKCLSKSGCYMTYTSSFDAYRMAIRHGSPYGCQNYLDCRN